MKCFIERRRDNGKNDQPDTDSAPGLAALPESLLLRHGARVLNPATAVSIPGQPAPRSTVYRARTLLVPGIALHGRQLEVINRVLAQVGMRLNPPSEIGKEPDHDGIRQYLPRPAVLTSLAGSNGAVAPPTVVDAWVALQTLQAAAHAKEQDLDRRAVFQISLEHLLIGAAITGSPITEGGGLSGGNPSGGGVTGPTSTDSYLYNGGDGRAPVDLCMEAPDWSTDRRCEEDYGRRAVVAVLDTGVRAHSWLGVHADAAEPGGYAASGSVEISQAMQNVIKAQALSNGNGDLPRQVIEYPWDQPVTAEPLVGELDTHTGHGTFIAGIVRQVAPKARVLSLRIMHSDGIVYEGDLICALGLLADRVAAAINGDMARMVDVICLSLGYFSETPADATYSSGLRDVINKLLELGVAVIAAAGNYATSRRFYPAAFAGQPPVSQIPLISVGALNPNGTKALFSDGGKWVTAWASGAAVISTFPQDINGSRAPEVRMRAHPANDPSAAREALDPDDYSGGFAAWSGTSFAAPLLAAHVVRLLMRAAAVPGSALRLNVEGTQAATKRVLAAFEALSR